MCSLHDVRWGLSSLCGELPTDQRSPELVLDLGGYEAGHWELGPAHKALFVQHKVPIGPQLMLCFHFLVHTGAHGSNSSYEGSCEEPRGHSRPWPTGVTAHCASWKERSLREGKGQGPGSVWIEWALTCMPPCSVLGSYMILTPPPL